MAEDKDESQEKTQDPTSRRLEKAREDGKVVSSKEMFVFTILTVGVILMYIFPPLIEDFLPSGILIFTIVSLTSNKFTIFGARINPF